MNWKRLAQETTLAELIDRLNQWATDADRRQSATLNPRSSGSASSQMALNRSFQVDSTRVSGLVTGSTGSSSLMPEGAAGSLQFKDGASLDGEAELTWQAAGNLLGVTGNAVITGGLTVSGLSVTSATFGSITGGISLSGGFSTSGSICPSAANLGNYLGQNTDTGEGIPWPYVAGNTALFTETVALQGMTIYMGQLSAASEIVFLGRMTSLNGASYSLNAQYDSSMILTAAAPAGISANGNLLLGSSATIHGGIGVTGHAAFAGGLTVTGGATFNGQVGMLAGLTVTGGLTSSGLITGLAGLSISGATVVMQPGGTNQILIGTSCIRPITTGLCDLGKPAQRFANINGQTGNFNGTFTAGATCLLGAAGRTSTLSGDWLGGGAMTMLTFIPTSNLNPETDIATNLGIGGPSNSTYLRWFSVGAAKYYGATVGIVASGTTITLNSPLGNYIELTGTAAIAGITQSNAQADQGGTVMVFGLSGNCKFTHGVQFSLTGGMTFSGQTGDHISFIGSGGDKWREVWRTRASGQLFQPVGVNKPSGWATLIAGVTTVPNALIGASTIVHLTPQDSSGTLGSVYISSRTVGVSFDISSTSALDTRLVGYTLIEPEGL